MSIKIIVFDEPISGLNSLTECVIKQLLFEFSNGKTTFIIGHRLSAVVSADKIIVLEKGKIVQTETHRELAQQEGLYRNMFAGQVLL